MARRSSKRKSTSRSKDTAPLETPSAFTGADAVAPASPAAKRAKSTRQSSKRSPTVTTPHNSSSKTIARVVTPSADESVATPTTSPVRSARRALLRNTSASTLTTTATTTAPTTKIHPFARKRLNFGTVCNTNVRTVYGLIRKLSGSVGGNGSFGAIYGELTMGSMQKMINLMKVHTGFSASSRFIDVGSGLGKPSIHVCQDPGVEFSYGIEMERSRWMLGMANLKAVVDAAWEQDQQQQSNMQHDDEDTKIGHQCYFHHGNILEAQSFDPFTHVYMFSIGFPPNLWDHLSKIFNASRASKYLICYHSPRIIIDRYGFNVELLAQTPTSMHGSSEGHMGYIYQRLASNTARGRKSRGMACDYVFQDAYDKVQSGLEGLRAAVDLEMYKSFQGQRLTRQLTRDRGVKICVEPDVKKEEEETKK